jgi:hypothetical protein
MLVDADFLAAYRALEARMRALAEADGDIYLPNPEPGGPVQYIFICMEPSIGRWGRDQDAGRRKVEAGFRNFVSTMEDFLLHFAIRRYLCRPDQRYHITDLSKGAMLVEHAGVSRNERYDRWYPLLVEELDLVAAPGARVFAVGNAVESHLRERGFHRTFKKIIHYSSQAGAARIQATKNHEAAFRAFSDSVSLTDVLSTARDVLEESAPSFRDQTLAELSYRWLSESQKRLIFAYKLAFEAV